MKTTMHNKLIRDKIPTIIKSSGKTAVIKIVSGTELLEMLNQKLKEELQEYAESGEVEELVDLFEVICGIIDFKNITLKEFEELRQAKIKERGAFKKGLVLMKVLEDD